MVQMMSPTETFQAHKALSKLAAKYGSTVSPFKDLPDLLGQFKPFTTPGRESGVRLVLVLHEDTPLGLAPLDLPQQQQHMPKQQQLRQQGEGGSHCSAGEMEVDYVAEPKALAGVSRMRSYVQLSGSSARGRAVGGRTAETAPVAAAAGEGAVVCGDNIVHANTGDRLVDSLSSWYLPYHGHQLFEVLPCGLVPQAPRIRVQGVQVDWKMNPWRGERSRGAKVRCGGTNGR